MCINFFIFLKQKTSFIGQPKLVNLNQTYWSTQEYQVCSPCADLLSFLVANTSALISRFGHHHHHDYDHQNHHDSDDDHHYLHHHCMSSHQKTVQESHPEIVPETPNQTGFFVIKWSNHDKITLKLVLRLCKSKLNHPPTQGKSAWLYKCSLARYPRPLQRSKIHTGPIQFILRKKHHWWWKTFL